jgi:hypothetical protein
VDGSIQTKLIVWDAMILLSLGVICVETKLPSKIYATFAFDIKDNVNYVIWFNSFSGRRIMKIAGSSVFSLTFNGTYIPCALKP